MGKYILEFEIPGLPKTPNSMLFRHWRVLKKEKDKWKRMVQIAVVKAGGAPDYPLEKAIIKVTRLSSVTPDFDGLVGSSKWIIDALVDMKVIIDDNMKVVIPEYTWEKAKPGSGKVRVFVSEP